MDNQEILSFVSSRYTEMKNAKTGFDQKWQKNENRRLSFLSDDNLDHLPTAWTVCQNISDAVTRDFDGSAVFIPTAEDYSSNDKNKNKHIFEKLRRIYNQENKKIGVQEERDFAIMNAIAHNKGIIFEGYKRKEKFQDSFDGLCTENIDPRDFFIDDTAIKFYDISGSKGARDCILRRWLKKEDLEAMKGKGFNEEAIQMAIESFSGSKVRDTGGVSYEDSYDNVSLVECIEYWDMESRYIICNNEILYKGANEYDLLPFAVYQLNYSDKGIWNAPSLLDILAPVLKQRDQLTNLWYENTKLSSIPLLFGSSELGLTTGQELRGGFQEVELTNGMDIRQHLQQIGIEARTDQIQNYVNFLDNEQVQASGSDSKTLSQQKQMTALEVKENTAREIGKVQSSIAKMMQSSESYRAILRAKNIMKFVFSERRNILLMDTEEREGELQDSEGQNLAIEIDDDFIKGFEFNVVIKSKNNDDIFKGEKRDQTNRLFENVVNFIKVDQTLAGKFNLEVLAKAIISTFEDLDLRGLMVTEEDKTEAETVSKAQKGEMTEGTPEQMDILMNSIGGKNQENIAKSFIDVANNQSNQQQNV